MAGKAKEGNGLSCMLFRNESAMGELLHFVFFCSFPDPYLVKKKKLLLKSVSKQREKDRRHICKGPEVRKAEKSYVRGMPSCSECRKCLLKRGQ